MQRALCIVAMLAARAHGEPRDFVTRPLVLDTGQIDAQLVLAINFAPHLFAAPTSLSPDVWFGATDRLTLGMVHSSPSVDRFSPAATFCVRYEPSTCPRTYRGTGLDARFGALAGELAVAPRARLLVREVDPLKPALTLGALVRWTRSRFAITADPYVQLGLANTELGNRHALVVPIVFAVQPLEHWELALHTGWNSDVAVIGDGWHIPVAIATRVAATSHVDVGALVGFATLLGPQNTPQDRGLFLYVGWRG